MKNIGYVFALVLGLVLAGCGTLQSADSDAEPSSEEEVNVGYGTQSKSKVTNAVASLSREDIERYRASSMRELLNRAPGFSSGWGLTVVDGVSIQQSELAGIHPNEVMSISLLKDAGATAIYGFQAGFSPVLVVTTVRGFN
jgi:hypothetical protein